MIVVTILVFGALAVVCAAATAAYFWLTPADGGHHAPRPGTPPAGARSPGLERPVVEAARRSPGVIHHEFTERDAATVTWLQSMRDLRHPGWTTLTIRRWAVVLRTITDVSGRAGVSGIAPAPAGGTTLPSRGDVQGRDDPACASMSGPAARADLTGSMSPRPPMEVPRVVSAPPPGPIPPPRDVALWAPTCLVPAASRPTVTAEVLAAVARRADELADISARPLDDYVAGLAAYEHPTAWFAAIGSDA